MAKDNPLSSRARDRLRALAAGIDQTIESAEFASIDLPLLPFTTRLVTSSRVVQSLARLYGWQPIAKQWRRLLVDGEGKLHVTVARVAKSVATISQVTVTDTASEVVTSNPDRVRLKIKNVGSEDVFIGTSSSVTPSSGWALAPGEDFEVNYYTGGFYALTYTGISYLAVYEV